MYFPYLRGRQFELIALREYASVYNGDNKIIPIIELVKNTFNNVKLAISKMVKGNVRFALVLNPAVGEINSIADIMLSLSDELSDKSLWIPTFIVGNSYNYILTNVKEYGFSNVLLICDDRTDIDNPDFITLLSSGNVKYIVSPENRSLKRKLRSEYDTIKLIRLDDNFKPLPRNKDYLTIGEEKFTEEHLFYKEDKYYGFSDFTVVRSDFLEGGGAAYAVSIHLTYKKPNDEIWIKHFTSVTNDSIANIQGKFSEAAKKAVAFLDSEGINTDASNELRKYVADEKYPGLGMVKKISIKHHLELVNAILQ